ncbi:hypothetical protein K501DRAFT_268909 [Backusella circina FSU 941]|nr:hypothetical protein K501DRAFT_268909 [Backusella circina FSU 941]
MTKCNACMLACHLWKYTIEEFCLFKTLHIFSPFVFKAIKKKTQEKPGLLSNVEQLTLHTFNKGKEVWMKFVETLPNIREFYHRDVISPHTIVKSMAQLSWSRSLEKMIDQSSKGVSNRILSNNMCPNLTHLNMSLPGGNSISLLKNAPALEHITLRRGTFTFKDINMISETLPNLKMLALERGVIRGNAPSSDITPAYSITRLILASVNTHCLETTLKLLRFITVKYPNLVEFVYRLHFIPYNDEEKDTLLRMGWDPLFKNLAPLLRKLHLSQKVRTQTLFATLDEHRCQINDLKIESFDSMDLPSFAQSQHVFYIKTLILRNTTFESFEWLKEMKVLETLEIGSSNYRFASELDFDDVLQNSPSTLKTLTLIDVNLNSKSASTKQTSIKTLEFFHLKLPQELSSLINQHFPLLSNLKIIECSHEIKAITLRLVELNSFHYFMSDSKNGTHVLVHTLYDDQKRLYSRRGLYCRSNYDGYDYRENGLNPPSIKSQPADNIQIKPAISLCCYTLLLFFRCILSSDCYRMQFAVAHPIQHE